MSYRKFQADQLFTGTNMLDNTNVLITDEHGVVTDITQIQDAGEDIQRLKGILTPGFINCHCHLELSHMKGLIPEKTGLVDFVFKVVTQRHFPDEEIAAAIKTAEDDMLSGGIVAVGDICNNTLTLPQKQLQRLAYHNFIEVSGWLPGVAGARFERSLGVYDAFESQNLKVKSQKSKVKNSLVPHAPYSVSDELWQLISPYFENSILTIHNQETAFEDDLFKNGDGDFSRMYQLMNLDTNFFKPTGKSSLQSYFPKLDKAGQVLLVHNTFTKEEDITFVKRQPLIVNWCICINANLYIENVIPPIELLHSNNCQLVIGTDSLASNQSLSILDEMKSIAKYFPAIPTATLLQWATLNGARALDMDDTLGSFEKGKQPGVLLLENADRHIGGTTSIKRLI